MGGHVCTPKSAALVLASVTFPAYVGRVYGQARIAHPLQGPLLLQAFPKGRGAYRAPFS